MLSSMRSRVLSSMSVLRVGRAVAPAASRSLSLTSFQRSADNKNNAPATQPEESFSSLVQKYGGWYPFLGLGAAVLFSKEVLILNEEFLLSTNFAVMAATMYFVGGEKINSDADAMRADIRKKHDAISDWNIEQAEAVLQAHELNVKQVDVLKALKQEYSKFASETVKAKDLKARQAARDAVVKRLSEIQSREASERASYNEIVSNKATAYVRAQFAAASPATKQQLIDYAIDVLEGKKKELSVQQDPIKKLYADYFEKKLYVKEIEEEAKKKQQRA